MLGENGLSYARRRYLCTCVCASTRFRERWYTYECSVRSIPHLCPMHGYDKDKKFLDHLWVYICKVKDHVERYRNIVMEYHTATSDAAHWDELT